MRCIFEILSSRVFNIFQKSGRFEKISSHTQKKYGSKVANDFKGKSNSHTRKLILLVLIARKIYEDQMCIILPKGKSFSGSGEGSAIYHSPDASHLEFSSSRVCEIHRHLLRHGHRVATSRYSDNL